MAERSEAKSVASRQKFKFEIFWREASLRDFSFAMLSNFKRNIFSSFFEYLHYQVEARVDFLQIFDENVEISQVLDSFSFSSFLRDRNEILTGIYSGDIGAKLGKAFS